MTKLRSGGQATKHEPAERPITGAVQDVLGRASFVRRLATALIEPGLGIASGVVVGLIGPWGCGKTSTLNLLQEYISKEYPKALLVRFNPWLISGRNDLVGELLQELLAAVRGGTQSKKIDKLKSALIEYGEYFVPTASAVHPLGGGAISSVLRTLRRLKDDEASLSMRRSMLRDELEKIDVPIVVLIDEVDRLDDDEIRVVAQLVRSVLDFKGISYLLAYDSQRVVEALGFGAPEKERKQRGQAYLEKIVQFELPIPVALPQELQALCCAELRKISNALPLPNRFEIDERFEAIGNELFGNLIATPRDIKRVVGAYHVLGGMVGQEVDWLDLFVYSVLQIKAPRSLAKLRQNPEIAVFNPLQYTFESAAFSALDSNQKFDFLIAEDERQPSIRFLVQKLFPKFGPAQPDFDVPKDRLTWRRPLLTTLRLGILPGAWSRNQVEVLVNRAGDDIRTELVSMLSEDRMVPFVDRLSEIYNELSLKNSELFWLEVSRAFRDDASRWSQRQQSRINLLSSVGDILLESVADNASNGAKALQIFSALESDGDVMLIAYWLLQHAYVHGLIGMKKTPERGWFLDRLTASDRILTNLAKWKSAHLAETLFEQVSILSPYHLLVFAEHWDDECSEVLARLVKKTSNLEKLILMMFGQHYLTGAETIERLCGADLIRSLVSARLDQGNLGPSPLLDALEKARDELGA